MGKGNTMKETKPRDKAILPRNFGELLNFFYGTKFDTEVKFGRFKVDFYSENMKLAFEYDVSKTTLCHWCQNGYLPSYKVGGHWRIDPEVDLESLSSAMNKRVRSEMKSKGWWW